MAAKISRSRFLIFSAGGLMVLFFLLVALWWLFRPQYPPVQSPPASPVQVFLLSPAGGEEFVVGDFIPLNVQAAGPSALQSVEFFVDGQLAASSSVFSGLASWSWLAWPTGIHTFSAAVTDVDGRLGLSPTAIVTVLAGGGVIQLPAPTDSMLGEIAGEYGVSPEEMGAANPNIDPSAPLQEGHPVNIPLPPASAGSPGGKGPSPQNPAVKIPFLINWQFKPLEPVDQSYCYLSFGGGDWEKIPLDPFSFLPGAGAPYSQIVNPSQLLLLMGDDGQIKVRMQCWGWVGGVLKYLGEAETLMDYLQPPGQVELLAKAFQMIGMPTFESPPQPDMHFLLIPPPFALREPADTADCSAHFGPTSDGYVCDILLNAPLQQYRILEWEWEPKTNWPGNEAWNNNIEGYRVYEIDKLNNSQILLQEIPGYTQKVAAAPLPWGYRCYAVEAFANGPTGEQLSTRSEYCPGEPVASQTMVLSPSNWLTAGGQWIEDGDCETYGGGDSYLLLNENAGFGNQPQTLVGSYIVDDDDQDCFRQGNYSGAVLFPKFLLPDGAVFQKALLKFSVQETEYKAAGVATNYHPDCVSGVGYALQDWSNLVDPRHFHSKNVLGGGSYFSPIASSNSLSGASGIDVTPTVAFWSSAPAQNYGFILTPAAAPHPAVDGSGICQSQVGNFQLEIYYFIAP